MFVFLEELDSMAEQDWLIFQKKLHLLDEFTTKWKGYLEPYTAVTLYIQQELEKYSVRKIPNLYYLPNLFLNNVLLESLYTDFDTVFPNVA